MLNLILLLPLLLALSNQALIPEDSFLRLSSHTPHKVILKEDAPEIYFSFINEFENTDIAINFAFGNDVYTYAYIYQSLESIAKDDQGVYINYDWVFPWTEKNNYIQSTKEKPTVKATLYIVIANIKKYSQENYITMFNENDIIKLEGDSPIVWEKMYSQNKYTLYAEAEANEIFVVEITGEIKTETTSSYKLLYEIDGKKEEYYSDVKPDIKIEFNTEQKVKYNYYIELVSHETPYAENNRHVVWVRKITKRIPELLIETPVQYPYISNNIWNFYADISKYSYMEEGAISWDILIDETKELKNVYAKVVNVDDVSDEKLFPLLPTKETNQFSHEMKTLDIINHHLVFRRNTQPEEGKNTTVLLVSIQFDFIDKFDLPYHIDVTLNKQFEPITPHLSDKIIKKEVVFTTKTQYYKLILPENNVNSFMIYTSDKSENPQIVYNNTLLINDKEINPAKTLNKIFAVSNEGNAGTEVPKSYIILLNSINANTTLSIEFTESPIAFVTKTLPINTFSYQLLNCDRPYYFIGIFPENQTALIDFEIVYGDFNYYYNDNLEEVLYREDVNTILPKDNEAYHIVSNYIIADSKTHLLGLQCTYPGRINLNILSLEKPDVLDLNSKNIFYLESGKDYTVKLPSPAEKVLNVEWFTPENEEINVLLGTEEIKLTKDTQKINKHLDNISQELTLQYKAVTGNTILIVKATQDKLYEVINDSGTITSSTNLLIHLGNKKDYADAEITWSPITEWYYSWVYSKGEELSFIPLPQYSNTEWIQVENEIKIKVTNPYDKYPQKEDAVEYYLAVQVVPSNVDYKIMVVYSAKEQHEVLAENEIHLMKGDNVLSIKPNDNLNQKLNIFSASCGWSTSKTLLKYYDDIVREITFDNRINSITTPNYNIDLTLTRDSNITDHQENYAGTFVSYVYGDIDTESISKNNKLNFNITHKAESQEISWEGITGDDDVQYELYIIDNNSVNVTYASNQCFLLEMKNNGDYKPTKVNRFSLSRYGNFTVNVVAVVTKPMPMRIMYAAHDLTSDEKSKSYLWFVITFPCVIIGVIVLILWLLKNGKAPMNVQNGSLLPESVPYDSDA